MNLTVAGATAALKFSIIWPCIVERLGQHVIMNQFDSFLHARACVYLLGYSPTITGVI